MLFSTFDSDSWVEVSSFVFPHLEDGFIKSIKYMKVLQGYLEPNMKIIKTIYHFSVFIIFL